MSYKVYAGAQDIVETLDDLKALKVESLDEGQIVVVREVEHDAGQGQAAKLPSSGGVPRCVRDDSNSAQNAVAEVKLIQDPQGDPNVPRPHEFRIQIKVGTTTTRKLRAYQILLNTGCSGCEISYVNPNNGDAENIGLTYNTADQIMGFNLTGNSISLSATYSDFLDFEVNSYSGNCDPSMVAIADVRLLCEGEAGEPWPYDPPTPIPIDGQSEYQYDINGDGTYDINDVQLMSGAWLQSPAGSPWSPNFSGEGTVENILFLVDYMLYGSWPDQPAYDNAGNLITNNWDAPQILASRPEGSTAAIETPAQWNTGWDGGCAAMCHKTQVAYYWDPNALMHTILSNAECDPLPDPPTWDMPSMLIEMGYPAVTFNESTHGYVFSKMIVAPLEIENNPPYYNVDGRWIAFNYESWMRLMWVEAMMMNASAMQGVMSQSMIPSANAAFDIGSASYKIRDLYVDGNSIWMGDDTKLTSDGESIKRRKRKTNWVPKMIQDAVLNHDDVGAQKTYATPEDKIKIEYATWNAAYGQAGKADEIARGLTGQDIENSRLAVDIELTPEEWLVIARDVGVALPDNAAANDLYTNDDFDSASDDTMTEVLQLAIFELSRHVDSNGDIDDHTFISTLKNNLLKAIPLVSAQSVKRLTNRYGSQS